MIGPLASRSTLGIRTRPRPATGDLGVIGLLIVVHVTLVTVASADPVAQFVRIPLSLALVMFVPGYCLTAAIFPREADLTGVERIGLGIALSIASVAVLVLVLDALPWRLQPWSLILGEYVLIGALAALALVRRWEPPAEGAIGSLTWPRIAMRCSIRGGGRRGYWATAIALAIVLGASAVVILLPPLDRFTTEFYAIGPGGRIGGYGYESRPDGAVDVRLGVVNREASTIRYRVEIRAVGESQGGPLLLQATPSIELAPGFSREFPVEWVMPTHGPAQRVDVLLFRTGGPDGDQPYRELTFWIDVPRS